MRKKETFGVIVKSGNSYSRAAKPPIKRRPKGESTTKANASTTKGVIENRSPALPAVNTLLTQSSDITCPARFCLLPETVIPGEMKNAAREACAFARKELELGPVKIKWFAEIYTATALGVEINSDNTFENTATLRGCVVGGDTDRFFLRLSLGDDLLDLKRTVLHEAYHLMQNRLVCGYNNKTVETNAEKYATEALKRLQKLPTADRQALVMDFLLRDPV